jgi:hypothetical protein
VKAGLIDVCGTLLLFGALFTALALAAARASKDWRYQLQVVRTLNLLAALDSPGEFIDLWEVVLTESNPSAGSVTIAFKSSERPFDVGVLELDVPLGDLAEVCAAWHAAETPLLFQGDAVGGAVLHGPDGYLTGRVVTWRDRSSAKAGWQ